MAFSTTKLIVFATLASVASVNSAPTPHKSLEIRQISLAAGTLQQNGLDAQNLNTFYATLNTTTPCQGFATACVTGAFAQCVSGAWTLTNCPSGTTCIATPSLTQNGTNLGCLSQADAQSAFSQAGVTGGLTGNNATASTTSSTSATVAASTTSGTAASASIALKRRQVVTGSISLVPVASTASSTSSFASSAIGTSVTAVATPSPIANNGDAAPSIITSTLTVYVNAPVPSTLPSVVPSSSVAGGVGTSAFSETSATATLATTGTGTNVTGATATSTANTAGTATGTIIGSVATGAASGSSAETESVPVTTASSSVTGGVNTAGATTIATTSTNVPTGFSFSFDQPPSTVA